MRVVHGRQTNPVVQIQLQQQLQLAEDNCRRTLSQLEAISQANHQLRQERHHQNQELHRIKEQCSNLESNIESLQEERVKEQQDRLREQKQLERLQQRLKQEQEHHQRQQKMQNERIKQLEAALDQTQRSLQDERKVLSDLKHSHESAWKGLPHELVDQLAQLRRQNSKLLSLHEDKTLEKIDGEEQLCEYIRQIQREAALQRIDLAEYKTKCQSSIAELHRVKAQHELQVINFNKEKELLILEKAEVSKKLQEAELSLQSQFQTKQTTQILIQQRDLLKIRLFVFEAMQVGHRTLKISPSSIKNTQIGAQIIENVSQLHTLMIDLQKRVLQQEKQKHAAVKKYKSYKEKYLNASQGNQQLHQALEREHQYQRIIEELQDQLNILCNEQKEQRREHIRAQVKEQWDESSRIQFERLKNQVKQWESLQYVQEEKRIAEINRYKQQIQQLLKEKNEWQQKRRDLENKLLEQTLNASIPRKNYQLELAQQSAALLKAQTEISSLRSQLSIQILQPSPFNVTVIPEKVNKISENESKEIADLKSRVAMIEEILHEKKHEHKWSQKAVWEEISQLKGILRSQGLRRQQSNSFEGEVQGYRLRLMELEDALKVIAQQSDEKGIELLRMNEQCRSLMIKNQKLENQISILKGPGGSLKQIEFIDANNQLQQQLDITTSKYQDLSSALTKAEGQIDLLRKQSDSLYEQNFKLLLVIKENNLQTKENVLLSEKYEIQRQSRLAQAQSRINNLTSEIKILKDLIEQLRGQLLHQHQPRSSQQMDNEVEEIRNQLAKQEQQSLHYRQLYDQLIHQRYHQKQIFQRQWNQLVAELNNLRLQIDAYQKKIEQPAPVQPAPLVQPQRPSKNEGSQVNQIVLMQKEALIMQKEAEIRRKESNLQLREFQLQAREEAMKGQEANSLKMIEIEKQQRAQRNFTELMELRQQIYALMQIKNKNEDQIRVLQHENSLLRVRRISEDVNKPIFQHQTFGPTKQMINNRASLINQLKIEESPQSNSADQNMKAQQCMALLVLAWNQIESLRLRVTEAQNIAQSNLQRYFECLKRSQESITFIPQPNKSLIKELECGHRHLIDLNSTRGDGLVNFANLAESVSANNLIESYSYRGQEQSMSSQDILHI